MLAVPSAPPEGAVTGERQDAGSIPTHGRMTREQVVDRIIQFNPTATSDYLAAFEEMPLRLYLARLCELMGQRGKEARWVRPVGEPAISGPREE